MGSNPGQAAFQLCTSGASHSGVDRARTAAWVTPRGTFPNELLMSARSTLWRGGNPNVILFRALCWCDLEFSTTSGERWPMCRLSPDLFFREPDTSYLAYQSPAREVIQQAQAIFSSPGRPPNWSSGRWTSERRDSSEWRAGCAFHRP
jgi:hypothetical protein